MENILYKEKTNVVHTQWTVITGAPSSGKTAMINSLAALGHAVRHEPATVIIERELKKGRTLDEICADQRSLQRAIFDGYAETDEILSPDTPHVLDRARPDSLAYLRLYGLDPAYCLAAIAHMRYERVLLLDRLPLQRNHVRVEDERTADYLDVLLEDVYRDLGYVVHRIPPVSREERLELVLELMRQ